MIGYDHVSFQTWISTGCNTVPLDIFPDQKLNIRYFEYRAAFLQASNSTQQWTGQLERESSSLNSTNASLFTSPKPMRVQAGTNWGLEDCFFFPMNKASAKDKNKKRRPWLGTCRNCILNGRLSGWYHRNYDQRMTFKSKTKWWHKARFPNRLLYIRRCRIAFLFTMIVYND